MPSEPALKIILRPPGRLPYAVTLNRLTAILRTVRTLHTMGRLAERLAKATDAIASVETAVDKDIDKLIERTQAVHRKREDVFMQKHEQLDRHMTDLSEFAKDLDDFGKNDLSGGGENSGNAYAGTNPNKG